MRKLSFAPTDARLILAGDLTINGDAITGIAIEIPSEKLKGQKLPLYMQVAIMPTELVDAEFARGLEREIIALQVECENLQSQIESMDQDRSRIYYWIEKHHPDGFIDSQPFCQNLDRIVERHYLESDSLREILFGMR